MDIIDESRAVIQSLNPVWHGGATATVDMLRLDLVHPIISGNKWYKLKRNLQYAKDRGFKQIVTFGGGYSNHLIATAIAAQQAGLPATGVVRGVYNELTPTLHECRALGMKLVFVTKEDYRKKEEPAWQRELAIEFDETLIIPEGGANKWGREGAEEITRLIPEYYTHVCVSAGTGTTLEGIRNGLPATQQVMGFVPMKGGAYLAEHIAAHTGGKEFELFDKWHFGGFGKWTDELIDFMNSFSEANNIPLDIVYTSKMMYGVRELLQQGFFGDRARVLCVHTGGLQGNGAVQERLVQPAV